MTDVPGWLVLTTILDRLQLARYPDLQLSMTKVELGEGPGPDPLPIRPSGWPDGINPKTGVPDPAVEIWINSDPSRFLWKEGDLKVVWEPTGDPEVDEPMRRYLDEEEEGVPR